MLLLEFSLFWPSLTHALTTWCLTCFRISSSKHRDKKNILKCSSISAQYLIITLETYLIQRTSAESRGDDQIQFLHVKDGKWDWELTDLQWLGYPGVRESVFVSKNFCWIPSLCGMYVVAVSCQLRVKVLQSQRNMASYEDGGHLPPNSQGEGSLL